MFKDKFQKLELQIHGVRLPEINVEAEEKLKAGAKPDCSNYDYLRALCLKGFKEKLESKEIPEANKQLYIDRVKEELKVLKDNNIIDYYLLVHKILNWCDENGIARGVGRGSSASSLIFFLIGCICNVDAVRFKLPFGRFISPARLQSSIHDGILYHNGASLPDFDADFSYEHRHIVTKKIDEWFPNRTTKIGTENTFTGKLCIKEICKAFLEFSDEETKPIANMLEVNFGKVEKLADAYENNEKFKEWVDSSPKHLRALRLAEKIELLQKNKGKHPSGIGISFAPLDDIMPLEYRKKTKEDGDDEDGDNPYELATSFNMKNVAQFLVKFDALGLKNADINFQTAKLAGIDYKKINIDDPSIYEFLCNKTLFYGLFQIEDGLTKRTVLDIKPTNIDHLAACVSLSRPGVFMAIPQYVDFVHKGVLKEYGDSKIDNILKETANIIIFQETINRLAIEIYGFDPIDAESLSYCIRKKKKDDIKKWEPILLENGKKLGINEEATKKVWATVLASADYQFCMGHAYSYAVMTAMNTYFKANYPKEFFLSLLKMAINEPKPLQAISDISRELPHFSIKLLQPDLLKSEMEFGFEEGNIRYGLNSVKGISDKVSEKLISFRKEYSSKIDMFLAAREAGVAINVLSALIQAGAMSSYEGSKSRAFLVLQANLFNILTEKEKLLIKQLSESTNEDNIFILVKKCVEELKDEKGRPLIKDSRFNTIKKKIASHKEVYAQNSKNEALTNFIFERAMLGYSYSQKLDEIYKVKNENIQSLAEVKEAADKEHVLFVGIVQGKVIQKKSKKGSTYIKFTVQDQDNTLDCFLFVTGYGDKIQECKDNNNGRLPAENDVVIINGTKKGKDAVYGDSIGIQDCPVFINLRELQKAHKNQEKEEKAEESTNNLEQTENPT